MLDQGELPELLGPQREAELAAVLDTHGRRTADRWSILAERPLPAEDNLALDEALLFSAVAGRRGPTLRFWGWAGTAIVLGRFQSASNEIEPGTLAGTDVRVVRRMSGGGTMYAPAGRVITWSLVVPEAWLAGLSIRDSYPALDLWAVAVLRGMGAAVRCRPVNDLTGPAGKLAGSAQVRRNGWVLHHTMLAWDLTDAEMTRHLRTGKPRLVERVVASAVRSVDPLCRQPAMAGRTRGQVVDALMHGFAQRFGAAVPDDGGGPTERESADAATLVRDKYGCPAWTGDPA